MTDLTADLKALPLYGMATCYANWVEQGSAGGADHPRSFADRVQAETTDRALRSIRYQMPVARFPTQRDLAGFDFDSSKVDRGQIDRFATTAFTEKAESIVLIGGTCLGRQRVGFQQAPEVQDGGLIRHAAAGQ